MVKTPALETAPAGPDPLGDHPRTAPRHLPDVLGIAWVIAAAAAVMTPALLHGVYLGPFDWLSQLGLSQQSGVTVHNPVARDQITQMIPWTTLAWTEVHQGHLPLWNPYSALGTPLAFNWQSSTFSLPALVGYLFPLRLDYTVQVLTTFVIAGTGVYVLVRLLRCGALASAFAATAFELSGAFMLYTGWPIASVMSWAGWLLAATILIVRGGHRARNVAFFALALALAIYAGQPDALIILGLGLAGFIVTYLVMRAISLDASESTLRPLFDLAIATVAGAALGAPLLLPGYQVARHSVRSHGGTALGGHLAFHFSSIGHFLFAGLNGASTTADPAVLGVITLTLAAAAVGLRLRQPEVVALGVLALAMAAVAFVQPVITFLVSIPGLAPVRWNRSVVLVALPLAVLSGLAMELLFNPKHRRSVLKWTGVGFLVDAGLLLVFSAIDGGHLTHGLIWSAIETALGLAGIITLALRYRGDSKHTRPLPRDRSRRVGAAFLVGATAYLVAVGAPLWSSSPSFITATPAETSLEQQVGSSLVGLGSPQCLLQPGLGIRPNVNAVFDIRELAVYDPLMPSAYFSPWRGSSVQPKDFPYASAVSTFCPGITSSTIARVYGVGFVLEPRRAPGPTGGVFDKQVGDEDLYRIPRSAAATLTPIPPTGGLPPITQAGAPVAVSYPGPASWRIVTHAATSQVLRLHLTDEPGWHATIDGRNLPLTTYAGVMLQARIPAGRHRVELNYWPGAFTDGIALAILSLVGLAAALLLDRARRRHPTRVPAGSLL